MKIIFLDYDGVVNTPIWFKNKKDKYSCGYGYPSDGKVNNFQAMMWVNELCSQTNAKIVVSSTWRHCGSVDYKECLYNGGLNQQVEILGCTPYNPKEYIVRGNEIQEWLDEHDDVDGFVILDDEDSMEHLTNHLVLCDPNVGFNASLLYDAIDILDGKHETK